MKMETRRMSQRVLVIEDNPPNLELMLYLLKAFGLEAEGSSTALDGIAKAEAGLFDLFLCDIQLPDLNGVEVARRLKLRHPKTPVVAVTALAMIGDQERLLASGFDGYIAKPLDPKNFVPTIQTYLQVPIGNVAPAQVRSSPRTVEHAPAKESFRAETILVVDDREESRYLILSVLKAIGFQVMEASSVAEGMRLAVEKHPAAIICDVNMPVEDGEAFLNKRRGHPVISTIPVIMVTSSDKPSPITRERFHSLGAKAYLSRPLDNRILAQTVEEAIRTNGMSR
jgi:two-component system cell cycle response regulator